MADLRALLAAATPRPWHLKDRGPGFDSAKVKAGAVYIGRLDYNDAALIVEAVNALPALLDVVEAARGVLALYDRFESWTKDGHVVSPWPEVNDLRAALAALDRGTAE